MRAATAADVPRILELIRELAAYERSLDQVTATEEGLRAALSAAQPAVFAHVAVADDDVVGFALWFVNLSTWLCRHGIYLEDLYVTPAMRGSGIGRAILAELSANCLGRGYGKRYGGVSTWKTT